MIWRRKKPPQGSIAALRNRRVSLRPPEPFSFEVAPPSRLAKTEVTPAPPPKPPTLSLAKAIADMGVTTTQVVHRIPEAADYPTQMEVLRAADRLAKVKEALGRGDLAAAEAMILRMPPIPPIRVAPAWRPEVRPNTRDDPRYGSDGAKNWPPHRAGRRLNR